jgi:hypothetical protein
MLSRVISGLAHAAIAGAAMLLLTSGPSASFTLYSRSLDQPVAASGVERVWWNHRHWHRHGWGWRHYYGYYHPYYHRYYHPYYYGYYQPYYYGYFHPRYYGYYHPNYYGYWHSHGDDDQD